MQRGPGSSPSGSNPASPYVQPQQGNFDMEMQQQQQQQPAPGSPNFGANQNQSAPPPRERLRAVPLIVASYNVRVE